MNQIQKRPKAGESGQAIILLALALTALLGFIALAVDGGILFVDRRAAQNAADAASLAGAGALARVIDARDANHNNMDCSSSHIQAALAAGRQAAIERAAENGYIIDGDASDNNGVEATCGFNTLHGMTYKYVDLRVVITVETTSSFAKFIYDGPLQNTVETVSRVTPRMPLAAGYAVISLDESLDVGLELSGGGKGVIRIHNSGAYTNSGFEINGSVEMYTDMPSAYLSHLTINGKSAIVSPQPVKVSTPMLKPTIPPPDCDSLPGRGSHSGSGTLQPGRYSQISINNGSLTLSPGLYCLYGDFSINGGEVVGNGVTIYHHSGGFSSGGNAEIHLTAPVQEAAPAMKGMLIYIGEGNTSGVAIRGTSTSRYQGTVYAPHGVIDLGGGGSALSDVYSQIIGKLVRIHGNTELDISYFASFNYTRKATIDLLR